MIHKDMHIRKEDEHVALDGNERSLIFFFFFYFDYIKHTPFFWIIKARMVMM